MSKILSEMTLEELWQLFPIILTAPNPAWPLWYEAEAARLGTLLPEVTLHHIGSTAVRGIWAKPIIDVLALAEDEADFAVLTRKICDAGYICMSREENRVSFNRGYTPEGFAEKVFHLHLRRKGDADELYFRDYLNAHPDAAKAYETLKLSLWKPFEHDRDGYTAAKTDFIALHTQKAKQEQHRQ